MTTEKLSPISRSLVAASKMSAPDARRVLMLICESGMTMNKPVLQEPTEGEKHFAKREKFIQRMDATCKRVIKYAKHETLRKIEKHFRESAIESSEGKSFEETHGKPGGLLEKLRLRGVAIRDVTPEGFGPTDSSSTSYSTHSADVQNQMTTEMKDLHSSILEGETLLKGDIDGEKRESVKKSISEAKKKLAKLQRESGLGKWVTIEGHHVFIPDEIKSKDFRDNPGAISSAESGEGPTSKPPSLAVRLTFDRQLFASELLAALREDQESALGTAGQQLFDEIGKDAVWRLPSQVAIQFIDVRANLLSNVPDEIHREIMDSIEDGLSHGESRRQLMDRISTAFDEIGKSRAETIANTETAAAFNYSRDKAMREAGVTHKRWLHSMSPLIKEPRPTHLEADGQTVPIDDPFDVGGVQFMRPADDSLGAGPEDIINCLPSHLEVSAIGVKKSMRRWFEGWLIKITLRSGRIISATPNHPTLGSEGWIPCCELHRGDYVISAPICDDFSGLNPHVAHKPTTFGQIHNARKNLRVKRILGIANDFHGDGFNSNVDIVFSDSALMYGEQASYLQHINQGSFALSDAIEELLPSLCMVDEFTARSFLTSPRILRESSESVALCATRSSHARELRFGHASDFDTGLNQSRSQPRPFMPDTFSDGKFALSELVCLDEIVNVDAFRFNGFVHNLDTKRGYYLSNGIFHRNCHCVSIAVETPLESGEGEGHPFRGNQYVLYHGSPNPNLTELDRRRAQSGATGKGIYTSTDPKAAGVYQESGAGKGHVYKVDSNPRQVFDLESDVTPEHRTAVLSVLRENSLPIQDIYKAKTGRELHRAVGRAVGSNPSGKFYGDVNAAMRAAGFDAIKADTHFVLLGEKYKVSKK